MPFTRLVSEIRFMEERNAVCSSITKVRNNHGIRDMISNSSG